MHKRSTHTTTKPRTGAKIENHVAMVTSYYRPSHGGIENHIHGLSRSLINRGWRVDILSASRESLPDHSNKGLSVRYTKSVLNPLNNPIPPGMFRNVCETTASVLHAHGLYQLTSMIAKTVGAIHRKPVVLTLHGVARYNGIMRGVQRAYESVFIKGSPLVDHFVALTAADEVFLRSWGVERRRISIIPNAVDIDYWCPSNVSITFPRTNADILFVGGLIRRKRPGLLIETFHRYLKENSDSRLLIVGDGPEKERLHHMIREYGIQGSVKIMGRISNEELRSLYRKSRALVLPSVAEGLPTVLLEAMACGMVVVSSGLPGIRHVISHGKNGFMFPVDDLDSLLGLLRDVNSLSPEKLKMVGKDAIDTVHQSFGWDDVADRMQALYHRVLNG